MNTHVKNDLKQKIITEYYNGKTVKHLCKRYSIKKSTLYQWIKVSKAGISQPKFETSLENKLLVVSLIGNGTSIKEVCHNYNIKQSTLYYWVHKYTHKKIDANPISRKQKLKDINRLETSIEILKSISMTNTMNILEKTRLITSLSNKYSISQLCELFNMQRSTYYAYVKKNISQYMERDIFLKSLIKDTYLRHKKRIGAVKIRQDLLLQDQNISLKKIYQLMKELEIRQITPKKNPYIGLSTRGNIEMPNLLKQKFNQKAPNLVWVSDITEIKINQKPVYLCVIIDLFSRKVIAHQVSRKNNTRLTMITLNIAMLNQKCLPNMFHSDRGVQYTSFIFRKNLEKLQITQSFSAPGYPYDNAVMESFFPLLKEKL